MINPLYASLALNLSYPVLQTLMWAYFHQLTLEQQFEAMLERRGFSKYLPDQTTTMPRNFVNYILTYVVPWCGYAKYYYLITGRNTCCCIQLGQIRGDKIYWRVLETSAVNHIKTIKRVNKGILISRNQICSTVDATIDALLLNNKP